MLVQHFRKLPFRTSLALLTVLAMLFALFPVTTRAIAVGPQFSLSQSKFTVGYPGTTVTVTGSDSLSFIPTTKLTLYDAGGHDMAAIGNVQYVDNQHVTFTLLPGVPQGTYKLFVYSDQVSATSITVLSLYDPTNVHITPGVNRDIRFDWSDPTGAPFQKIIIHYGPMTDQNYTDSVSIDPGVQTYTLTNLPNKTLYKFNISTVKADGTETSGVPYDNNGQGYLAVDTTPPNLLTNVAVTAVPNGFQVNWTDPTDPDLSTVNVQYAEHGTSNWSSGLLVAKGTQSVLLTPLNTSKRYDLRFTLTDTNGNWSYLIDTHNGYGYTLDTTPPADVQLQPVSPTGDTGATLAWTDPTDTDFHHVNIYLRSDLTDWTFVGKVAKGVQADTLSGLAAGINYQVKVTTVDNNGNESAGVTQPFTTDSSVDFSALTNVTIAQEPQGGLQMTWDSTQIATVDFTKFKMYYAPITSTNVQDYRQTVPSNLTATSAMLRDMPRGTYQLQMRLFDSYGIQQALMTYTNVNNAGYYVSGSGNDGPTEVGNVRIQPTSSQDMLITWDAASTNGSSIKIYEATTSDPTNWSLVDTVNKNLQQYTVTGLSPDTNYDFKLVVVDDTQNTQSPGVVYNNNGYGYNVLGGNNHPPHEVTNASATVSYNTINVTYTEPTDSNFDSVKIYVIRKDTGDTVSTTSAPQGSNGATLINLLPNIAYNLKITTVDTYGDESAGILLTNSGQGYTLVGGTVNSPNEVQNALLVPTSNQMTVRFQDPSMIDYGHALVSIKQASDTAYGAPLTVSKGTNEVTFYNLQPNQQYDVHIATVSTGGQISPGIDLGGTTGIGLQPLPDPTNVIVTPGNTRLTVDWQSPANTVPTSYQVQVEPVGGTHWSDPMIVQPGTTRAVFHGLPNNKAYLVRVATIINNVSSPGAIPGDASVGFTVHPSAIAASPSVLQTGVQTQVISLLGTNTNFPWNTSQMTLQLYDPNGNVVSGLVTGMTMYNSNRVDVTLSGNLNPGPYKLVLQDPNDGQLTTALDVQALATPATLDSESSMTANYGYNPFTMTLNGTGFTTNSTVLIDGLTSTATSYSNSQQLNFQMPTGLLPGQHTLTVNTGSSSTGALGFTVFPFTGTATLTAPTVRSGNFLANLSIQNLDQYTRNTQVLLAIYRNGLYVETKVQTLQFAANETKTVKFNFGGGINTPYTSGPTTNISVQAYVVDGANLAPLANPISTSLDVNL